MNDAVELTAQTQVVDRDGIRPVLPRQDPVLHLAGTLTPASGGILEPTGGVEEDDAGAADVDYDDASI